MVIGGRTIGVAIGGMPRIPGIGGRPSGEIKPGRGGNPARTNGYGPG